VKHFPICDLHADLLCYLAHDSNRTFFDRAARCSIPQLKSGGVQTQILPIFVETAQGSVASGAAQAQIFQKIRPVVAEAHGIGLWMAIENASSFSDENEPIQESLKRLEAFQTQAGKILYISLTWNTENRFGGGAHTQIGLKRDGKLLLEYLHQKKIAVDLSHASDPLAFDILNYLDVKNLEMSVLASHSNFRQVTDAPRNLPDELACEIWRRKGVIGLNFVRYFIGAETPLYFVKQLEHVLKLGGEKQICFGADFFYGDDVSPEYRKSPEELFFPDYQDATTYSRVISLWKENLQLDEEILEGIAYKNFKSFFMKFNLEFSEIFAFST
jgi:membrane dipeptidase